MDLDKLAQTPAAALGSCRYKLAKPEQDTAQYRVLIDISGNMTSPISYT